MKKKKYGLIDCILIPCKASKVNAMLIILKNVLNGLIPSLQLVATASFIDSAIGVLKKGNDFKTVILPITVLVILISYSWLSQKLENLLNLSLENKLRKKLRVEITEKTSRLKFKHIENKDTWELITRISGNCEKKFLSAFSQSLGFFSLILSVGGIMMVLLTQVWWAAIIIIALAVPLMYFAIKGGEDSYKAEKEATEYGRRCTYLAEVLNGRDSAGERTLFGYTDNINKKWEEAYESARKIGFRYKLKYFLRMKLSSSVFALFSVGVSIIMVKPALDGVISTGMFISIVNSMFQLINLMSWGLSSSLKQLSTSKELMKDYTKFIHLDEVENVDCVPKKERVSIDRIEFKDVKFKYPNTEKMILNGMSFVIERGKHYAFVGTNGAGKTTVTKLLTGLYDNYEGEILINERNLRSYSQEELKSMYAVVYQDFAKYFISVKDNIALGDINNVGVNGYEENIKGAMETISLTEAIEELPNGMDTYLGKIKEGGQDLSGGQWQRLAMARAIINPADMRILDEPTAALDPISESEIYEEFNKISKGGTTIFISHRLGSTKLADKIFVLDKGAVVEKGSHEELICNEGIYAEMYESQRSWYA